MHRLIVVVLSLLLFLPGFCLAQGTPKKPAGPSQPAKSVAVNRVEESKPADLKSEFAVVGKMEGKHPADFEFKMGETIMIKASGSIGGAWNAERRASPLFVRVQNHV